MPVIKQQCQNLQNWFVNNLFIQTKAEQEQLGFCLKFRCLYKMEEYILKWNLIDNSVISIDSQSEYSSITFIGVEGRILTLMNSLK